MDLRGTLGEVDLRGTLGGLALMLVPHPHFFVVKKKPVFILGGNLGILPLASSL